MPFSIIEKHTHPKHPRLVFLLTSQSQNFLARTYLKGKLRYKSTSTPSLRTAFRVGDEWYVDLKRRVLSEPPSRPKHSKVVQTLGDVFAQYRRHLSSKQLPDAEMIWSAIRSFWENRDILSITPTVFKEFYAVRRSTGVGNHTLHKNVTLIRQILKHCAEEEMIAAIPFIPRIGKIEQNPKKWLSPDEWQHLRGVSRQRIKSATNVRTRHQRQECHDFMVFMVHSMMRVDEVKHLRFGDCELAMNGQGDDVLIVNVRVSKTGPRPNVVCLVGAASVYKRRLTKEATDEDLIFKDDHVRAFQSLLKAADLYEDGSGNTRNRKSLRATGISFRILEGANVTLIANNSGTSISSISNFYAKHLRGTDDIDALTTITRLTK
jgi:hypothetical protein